MNDLRTVGIDEETIQILESVGEDLVHQHDEARGLQLLTLVLTWRSVGQRVFQCNIDESAGMADVVDLNGYSSRCVK